MAISTSTRSGQSVHTTAWRPFAAAFIGLGMTMSTHAGDKSWVAGDGEWHNPANWSPFGVPGLDDFIYIGNLGGVQNSTVMLGPVGAAYDLIQITDGMTLDMDGGELVSFDLCSITGTNSTLIARPAVAPLNPHHFNGTLYLGAGAHFELHDNVPVRVHNDSESYGTISGRGLFEIADWLPFNNSGTFQPTNNGGLVVRQGMSGEYPIDLDGSTGDGELDLTSPFAELEVIAESLADNFSGSVWMVPGSLLTMTLDQSWVTDSNSLIYVLGQGNPAAASQIAGSEVEINGTVIATGSDGHLRFVAPTTFGAGADVTVDYADWIEFDGTTVVNGGLFTVHNGGQLDFDGQTTMSGGVFDTFGTDPADGSVDFYGAVTWNGGCTIDGVARQFGNAFVGGPTVINAEVFDMDGVGATLWTVWNDLVVNADAVQTNNPFDFHGTLNVASTNGKLTVNLPVAAPLFSMAGEMNLIGHPAVYKTRYAGTMLDLKGDLNVTGKVVMEGPLRAYDGALDIATNAVLQLDAGGLLSFGCAYSGDGELRIGAASTPRFTNVNLGAIALRNEGNLIFDPLLTVDRFDGIAGSDLHVSLGGTVPGVSHDQLVVTNAATLGGDLRIVLQDNFVPDPGDIFTVLTAGDLTGALDNVADGNRLAGVGGSFILTYDGSIDSVLLHDFVPCPADLTGDGAVDILDLLTLLERWGTPNGDVNYDDATDILDLLELLSVWGSCP